MSWHGKCYACEFEWKNIDITTCDLLLTNHCKASPRHPRSAKGFGFTIAHLASALDRLILGKLNTRT